MSNQWPSPVYVDGNLDVAEPCRLPVFDSPIRATTKEYIFRQKWCCSRVAFAPTPLNTPHPSAGQYPEYSQYGFVSEGSRNDIGGGMVEWERTYAIAPDSHDEFESYSYQFIGWQTFTGSFVGRPRLSRIVLSRVAHDYFLVGSGGSYALAGDMPVIPATRYVASQSSGYDPANASDIGFIANGLFPDGPYGTGQRLVTYHGW